jgi:CHASE2 domain-containing sensor protein
LRSANPAERLAAVLLIPSVLAKRLCLLRDPQLAQLLEDEVWSRMNLLAPESTICLAAVDRLRGHVSRQHKPNESEGGT